MSFMDFCLWGWFTCFPHVLLFKHLVENILFRQMEHIRQHKDMFLDWTHVFSYCYLKMDTWPSLSDIRNIGCSELRVIIQFTQNQLPFKDQWWTCFAFEVHSIGFDFYHIKLDCKKKKCFVWDGFKLALQRLRYSDCRLKIQNMMDTILPIMQLHYLLLNCSKLMSFKHASSL